MGATITAGLLVLDFWVDERSNRVWTLSSLVVVEAVYSC